LPLILHDSVAQKIVVAKLNLETLGNELNSVTVQQQKIFNSISSLLEESTTEVRHLSHSMMPQAFAHSGITLSVKEFLDKIEKSELNISFNAEGIFSIIKENTALMIYRIIQECVQNVLKHANATQLDISMMSLNNEIDVTIEDNGVGFSPMNIAENETSGLKNIKSRVEYLGGKLDISTNPGMGTVMAFYIPVK
jgi:two-component system NarL family sensor kinase